MIGKWRWNIRQMARQIWVRAVSYALLGVVTALIAAPLGPLIPRGLEARLGAEAVDRVLSILASSMLAVTTFSLAIMVSALAAASSAATPRVAQLLYEDRTSQTVLASFIGAFLYSLVGLISVQAGAYDEGGRLLLFIVTIAVVIMIVVALLRWISHLMVFGRMSDAIARAETAASRSIRQRRDSPCLGGRPLAGTPPKASKPLMSQVCGYIQHIDMPRLHEFSEARECRIWLSVLPGSYLYPGRELLRLGISPGDEDESQLRGAFTVGKSRNFDQDPRFGLIVLAEIASRALSPSVNDPGTAIEVIGRLAPVLLDAAGDGPTEHLYPQIFAPPIGPDELLADAFLPIARDGAGLVEVQLRLLKALAGIVTAEPHLFGRAAVNIAERALRHSERTLLDDSEKVLLLDVANRIKVMAGREPLTIWGI